MADGREILIEVGRHFGEVLSFLRLNSKTETDAGREHGLHGLRDSSLVNLDRLPANVEIFCADGPRRLRHVLGPFQVGLRQLQCGPPTIELCDIGPEVGDLVVHLLHGMPEIEEAAAGLGHHAARLGHCRRQILFRLQHGGLLDVHLHLVRFLIDLHQEVALFHAVVFLHQEV